MIVITRDLARRFRAMTRKCLSGRPRGPAPPVAMQARAGTLTLWAKVGEVEVMHTSPTTSRGETLVVPLNVLETVEGSGSDPVELADGPKLQGVARWNDRGTPRSLPFAAIRPGQPHQIPEWPARWQPLPPSFRTALHECGRTAARESARFALNRVQVKGRAGQVIGTDGRQALLWGGFTLPFTDDLLVPASPVFGAAELSGPADVRVGLDRSHLVVAAGPWRIRLPVDRTGRYPDVAGVIPKPPAASVAGLDARDGQALLAALPGLPGADADDRPVTLELSGGVVVRARDPESGTVRELVLSRSPAAGPPVRVALDRAVLARLVSLGCHTVRVATEGKPLVAEGEQRMFVALPLDPLAIVPPSAEAVRTATVPLESESRRAAVKSRPPEHNGHRSEPRPESAPIPDTDPLAEAEALKATLLEAVQRASRLVAALRQTRRQKRALSSVWSSLKSLNLGR